MTTETLRSIASTAASFDPNVVMQRLYEESRRKAADLPSMPQAVPVHLRPTAAPPTRRVELPAPLTQSHSLQQALRMRGAVRVYDEAPLTLAELGTVFHTAMWGDQQDWPQEAAAGVGLQLLAVAWRVDGLEPAIWRYEPQAHELAYVGVAPAAHEAETLTLQLEFTAAPVIVFITGNLAAACARYGEWGHRQMLLRGGAAGQRLWLSSIGLGLCGSVFAGFVPRAAQRFAKVDGYLQASLLAFAVGRPPRSFLKLGDAAGSHS